jgi:oligopeptide transport system permease protein
MATYIIRRVLAMIPALLGISLITFVLMHMAKGGPFDREKSTPSLVAAVERLYHLNEPLWPTFNGPGSEIWQIGTLVLGALLLVGGLVVARRRPGGLLARTPTTTGGRVNDAPPLLTGQSVGRLGAVIGGGLVFWWVVMLVQGPATKVFDSGFIPGQYLRFLWSVIRLDLGPSFSQRGLQVTEIIIPAARNSFVLGLSAFALLVLVAVPLGVIAAVRQNTWIDYFASTFALIGYSIPNFVMGLLLLLIFGLQLGWLPIGGWGEPKYVILPAFVLAIRPMAVLMRLTRASMLEVLHQDYIRTAWSKGLSGRIVLVRHALRNALLPVVTVMGDQLGDLVTGSLVVETLFIVNGVGQKFVESVQQRDYGMIMGTTLFYAVLVLSINLVVDLLYGVIDPRVRLGGGSRS